MSENKKKQTFGEQVEDIMHFPDLYIFRSVIIPQRWGTNSQHIVHNKKL